MSARRFAEWQAYCAIEPFGPPAAFWQAGLIASMLANVNRTKKSQKAFAAEDFMPSTMIDDTRDQDLTERCETAFREFRDVQLAREQAGRRTR